MLEVVGGKHVILMAKLAWFPSLMLRYFLITCWISINVCTAAQFSYIVAPFLHIFYIFFIPDPILEMIEQLDVVCSMYTDDFIS